MDKYTFKFKYEGEKDFWQFTMNAEEESDAIKEAKEYIKNKEELGLKIIEARIEKPIYKTEKIWEM